MATKLRSFRAADSAWLPFVAAAERNGVTATDALLALMQGYVAAHPAAIPELRRSARIFGGGQ